MFLCGTLSGPDKLIYNPLSSSQRLVIIKLFMRPTGNRRAIMKEFPGDSNTMETGKVESKLTCIVRRIAVYDQTCHIKSDHGIASHSPLDLCFCHIYHRPKRCLSTRPNGSTTLLFLNRRACIVRMNVLYSTVSPIQHLPPRSNLI